MLADHIFLALFLLIFTANSLLVISDSGNSRISTAPADELTKNKSWSRWAIQKLWHERSLMGVTPIHAVSPPTRPHIRIVFKNESASPTGSLKHRYAWALMMWALLEGHIRNGTHIFEASSGNTACSLGYMCKLLGLRFTAVRLIRAEKLARQSGGFFMNQFKNAYYAEDFHESGNSHHKSGNLMHELMEQLDGRSPDFFVHPAGTGGTISSVGRYVKKYGLETEIVLADTEFSVYYDYVLHGNFTKDSGASQWVSPGMAGIGYGSMGPAKIAHTTSLDPAVIDRVLKIPDLASTAAMHVARDLGISGGTSTGVNFLAALHIAAQNNNKEIVIATILADSGKYYEATYLDRRWIAEKFQAHGGLEIYDCWVLVIKNSWNSGSDPLEDGRVKCSVTTNF
uniref:Tryptophan synthase beta chain-like PALP domain-containing protein n=1 Tax=Caenorhabditis japonica TaxID=281687 RepID=A0A8R1DS31_CAEJA